MKTLARLAGEYCILVVGKKQIELWLMSIMYEEILEGVLAALKQVYGEKA